jgi:hypothetical protein
MNECVWVRRLTLYGFELECMDEGMDWVGLGSRRLEASISGCCLFPDFGTGSTSSLTFLTLRGLSRHLISRRRTKRWMCNEG